MRDAGAVAGFAIRPRALLWRADAPPQPQLTVELIRSAAVSDNDGSDLSGLDSAVNGGAGLAAHAAVAEERDEPDRPIEKDELRQRGVRAGKQNRFRRRRESRRDRARVRRRRGAAYAS